MKKTISLPIAITILVVCAVLTGFLAWQYGLIPGVDLSSPLPTPPEDETADWKTCVANSDCIIVDGDCCGCSMGGTATTINKELEEEWKNKLSKECKEVGCIAVISNDPSCFQKPKCISNTCQLVEDETADCLERYPEVVYEDCIPGEVVDGWRGIVIYPDTLNTSNIEHYIDAPAPDIVGQAGIARYSTSSSTCRTNLSIKTNGEWKGVSQIEFCNFIIDYNSSCNDCLLDWEEGCC